MEYKDLLGTLPSFPIYRAISNIELVRPGLTVTAFGLGALCLFWGLLFVANCMAVAAQGTPNGQGLWVQGFWTMFTRFRVELRAVQGKC